MDAAAEPLTVEASPITEGLTVLRVGGELDVHTAPTLIAAVAQAFEAGATSLEIDAAHLQFCDSSGIQVLVQAREQALAADGTVRVTNVRGPVEKVLTVTGLLELFS
jgi:anti-sigma B factor antagonist